MLKALQHCLDWWSDAMTHGNPLDLESRNLIPCLVGWVVAVVIHCPAFSHQPFLRLIYSVWPRVMKLKANMTHQNLIAKRVLAARPLFISKVLDEIALIGRPYFLMTVYSSTHCKLVSDPATTPTKEQDVSASYWWWCWLVLMPWFKVLSAGLFFEVAIYFSL